jgi:hypothetical protein
METLIILILLLVVFTIGLKVLATIMPIFIAGLAIGLILPLFFQKDEDEDK